MPMQRNQLFKIASNQVLSPAEVVQSLIAIQKEKLYRQVDSLIRSIAKNDGSQTDIITNRNEKFCQDPVQGLNYLNHVHLTYYLNMKPKTNNDPYDIMQLDEASKELLNGGGFKSYISCLGNIKNVFIPIETTQEIILFRYEKLQKMFAEPNYVLTKRLSKYFLKSIHRVQSSKPSIQSVHRLPIRQSVLKRQVFAKNRMSKQYPDARGSHTFQDGFLTDKEAIDHVMIMQECEGDIMSNLKQIILGNARQQEIKCQLEQQKKLMLRETQRPKVIVQSSLILCGKQLQFPSSDLDKKRNLSNLDKQEKDNSLIQVAKNSKLQKLGLTSKYHLVKIKQNCSQLKLQQLQL